MANAYAVGGAAGAFGDFMQGILKGKRNLAEKESAERSERYARVGQLFDASNSMRQQAGDENLTPQERDRRYEQAESLFSSYLTLSGQLDDKPAKQGKKQSPFMQFLSVMNPFAQKDQSPGQFDENFSKVMSSLAPGAIPGATGEAGPAGAPSPVSGPVGSATGEAAQVNAAAPGTISGFMGPGAPAKPGAGAAGPQVSPGATATPEAPPYISPYFKDPEAEKRHQYSQVNTMFKQLRESIKQKGIKSLEDFQAFPEGQEMVGLITYLAGQSGFDQWDEADEVYAALGIKEAPSAKNRFEEERYGLMGKEGLTDTERDRLAVLNLQARGPQSGRPLAPNLQLLESLKERYPEDFDKVWELYTKQTTGPDKDVFTWRTAENPETGKNEIVSLSNRTRETEFTGLKVPSNFKIDEVLVKDFATGNEYLSAFKISWYRYCIP